MLGFLHFMLSYSPLSPSFHSSPSVWLQKIMWHCLIPCLQNALFFYLHPVLLCFFQISKHILCTLSGIALRFYLPLHHSSAPRALSQLHSWFPSVNREHIVHSQILSVLGVDCFVCGNHHDGLRSPRCLQGVQVDVSTRSPSLCFDSLQTTVVFGLVRYVCSSSPFKWGWRMEWQIKPKILYFFALVWFLVVVKVRLIHISHSTHKIYLS